MKIWYMNGAGNDFMVMDARGGAYDFQALSVELCKLTNADGFMAIDHSEKADFKLHFYNSDGSRGEMCGNGARCICRFAHDLGLVGDSMVVETDAGLVPGWRLSETQYKVKLNNPGVLDPERLPGTAYVELGCPGVPHAVFQLREDIWANADALKARFEALRHDSAFPKGANVNAHQWIGEAEVRVLTFERGVEDYTLACGTGCGSTAAALWATGKLPGGRLLCHNRGGDLTVTVSGENGVIDSILLEGPTEVVKIYEL